MAQKKPASRSGAKKKKPATAAKRAVEREPAKIPVRQILAGACFLLTVLALFACLGFQGFILAGVKSLLGGLVGPVGFYLSPVLFGYLLVLLLSGSHRPVGLRSLAACLFVVAVSAIAHLCGKREALPGGFAMVGQLFRTGGAGTSGGVLGGLTGILFELALSKVVAVIVLATLALLSLLWTWGITLGSICRAIQNRPRPERPPQEQPREDPAAVVVNHIANKHIAHLERKRQAAEFDVPVDDLPVGRSAKKEKSKSQVPSPDAFLESQRKAARIQQEPSVPFDEEPISGNTVIPSAHQEEFGARAVSEEELLEFTPEADADIAQAVMQAVAPMPEEPALEKVSAKDARASAQMLAQKLRKTPRRHDTLGEANPLTGLVFCADCGAKMMNHRSRGGTENNPYPSDFYDCSTYTLAHQKRTHACSGHYIRSKVLRELILETIRAASTFAISDRDAFLEKVRSASQLRQAEAAKETKRRLNKEKKRISELDTIIKKLYESFAVGRITGERFDSLLADYENEQKALTASVSEMETQMSAFAEDTDRAKQFLELAKKYTDFSELTTPMINEFVEKIIVHAPEKIDGDRVQEVDIHLRFIGQFELPAPELTEEEIKRQEQLKRHRIKSRERYQKIKAGEHAVGQPFMLTCKCCGQEFASKRTNTLFCGPNCRSKFYRQEAAESRSRECTCENCGKVFTTTRSDVKYCGDDCRYQAQIKRQGVRKKALRGAKIEPAVPEKETKTA